MLREHVCSDALACPTSEGLASFGYYITSLFSRKSTGPTGQRIRNPRHFLLYRITEFNEVKIGRVLRDSMELQEQLPEEYRGSPE